MEMVDDKCLDKCGDNFVRDTDTKECVCEEKYESWKDECKKICPDLKERDQEFGWCKCIEGYEVVGPLVIGDPSFTCLPLCGDNEERLDNWDCACEEGFVREATTDPNPPCVPEVTEPATCADDVDSNGKTLTLPNEKCAHSN